MTHLILTSLTGFDPLMKMENLPYLGRFNDLRKIHLTRKQLLVYQNTAMKYFKKSVRENVFSKKAYISRKRIF